MSKATNRSNRLEQKRNTLEGELNELVEHIIKCGEQADESVMTQKKEIDGLVQMVHEKCPCQNIEDAEFHNYFKLINWDIDNLKMLNRVQDDWSRNNFRRMSSV